MPEGDTIFRTATTLRPAMEGGVIENARIRDRQFECERIIGRDVTAIEARGKHLLIHLAFSYSPPSKGGARREIHDTSVTPVARSSTEAENPSPSLSPGARGTLIIHSHMGMTGSWHVYHPGQPWRKPTHYAALELSINNLEVICFSPRLLELLTADQLRRHAHIHRLGPDLLAHEFDMPTALARFRARNSLPLGEAVMNQTLVCGIGNIYKSEILYLMAFDPFAPVERFSDDELTAMLQKARYLLRRNSGGPNRMTRFGSDAGRMWVYGNSGRPCPKCGTIIELRRQGDAGRTTCWCPECQPAR
jgi:endonuclease-8